MGTLEKRVGRRFRLGKIIGRRHLKRYSLPGWYRLLSSRDDFYRQMFNKPDPCSIKCMTFQPNALPDEIKARMKANQEKARINIDPIIPADAVCMECGTTKENAKNGFCINGHDNWLELTDDLSRFDEALKKLNTSSFVIIHAIMTNTDIEVKTKPTLL